MTGKPSDLRKRVNKALVAGFTSPYGKTRRPVTRDVPPETSGPLGEPECKGGVVVMLPGSTMLLNLTYKALSESGFRIVQKTPWFVVVKDKVVP